MKTLQVVLGCLLAMSALQANAQGINYSYVEAGFSTLEYDVGPVDVDGDGFDLVGSLAVTDMLFLTATFSDTEFDFNIDATEAGVGVGGHTPLSEQTDLFGIFALIDAEIGSNDESGYGFDFGLRHLLNDQVELEGGFGYQDVYDESGTSFTIGGRYHFENAVSATISFSNTEIDDNDISGVRISIRLNF